MTENTDKPKKADIVIVDDEISILKELRILLGRTYNVHIFENPEEAEVFVDNNEVDMVISDEMMPEMRGSVLLARIHEKHPDICNVVLSGQAEKDDIVRAVNEGHIFSFLYKPTERQQLQNVIEKGLENRKMKLQLARQNVQLKQYSENLEKMVEEKTAQLVQAYDRLDMLDENKIFFLVYLSQEIDSSLDRIQQLAEVLLNYFAFAGTELHVVKQPVSLKDIVEEILLDLRKMINDSGVTLDNTIDENVNIMADPQQIRRVITIIIENAFVYTPESGRVRISADLSAEGGLRFCVSDTGRGIVEENLTNVFKPFVIDRSLRHPDGFGLNLPVAKSIITAHGGEIWVESDGLDQGATFCIKFKEEE